MSRVNTNTKITNIQFIAFFLLSQTDKVHNKLKISMQDVALRMLKTSLMDAQTKL